MQKVMQDVDNTREEEKIINNSHEKSASVMLLISYLEEKFKIGQISSLLQWGMMVADSIVFTFLLKKMRLKINSQQF